MTPQPSHRRAALVGGALCLVVSTILTGFPTKIGNDNLEIEATNLGASGLDLTVETDPGETVAIEASDALAPGQFEEITIGEAVGGTFSFTDPDALTKDRRFYRSKLLEEYVYSGDALYLLETENTGFGPGSKIFFDIDGNGSFESMVVADDDSFFTTVLDATGLPDEAVIKAFVESSDGSQSSSVSSIRVRRNGLPALASNLPSNLVSMTANSVLPVPPPAGGGGGVGDGDGLIGIAPATCTCIPCLFNEGTMTLSNLSDFGDSFTPTAFGVELGTGQIRSEVNITKFGTRFMDFAFDLHHASLTYYNGPFGCGVSHSFNMMIIQLDATTGLLVTPNLRIFGIGSEDGVNWQLPDGFFTHLTLDTDRDRWTLTHFTGMQVEFFQGLPGKPGYPIAISEPNGNAMRLDYNPQGKLVAIETDLGQVETLDYDAETGRLAGLTDHIDRQFQFGYSAGGHLEAIGMPPTEFAAIPAGVLLTDTQLAPALVTQPRVVQISYGDPAFPDHITALNDPRGAVPRAYTYDSNGRVDGAIINGQPATIEYAGLNNPLPVPTIEAGNLVTRVTDREGNLTDYEIIDFGNLGELQIRRTVTWTESGRGNPALRETEPNYYEQIWVQDCDCGTPVAVSQPFSDAERAGLVFTPAGVPSNWPVTFYTRNQFRQPLVELYVDGPNQIRKEWVYQGNAFGDGNEYSKVVTARHPRAFDPNPINGGLTFETSYAYDNAGNVMRIDHPTASRGVAVPQPVAETFVYNPAGQLTLHTDANGNITTHTYHSGPSAGGTINTAGTFGGYRASTTTGAVGSTDPQTSLTISYRVNALGLVTERTDPAGFVYAREYNDLQELVAEISPAVTLRDSSQVQYETRHIYDGAGNKVMSRRSNVDFDGAAAANNFIDVSRAYDAVGNLVAERREVDANEGSDLVTVFRYDRNDDLTVIQKPEGNREFFVYDERRLKFRQFYGIAPGPSPTDGYPANKAQTTLGGTPFTGIRTEDYDSRRNWITHLDGRSYVTTRFYDFRNRQVAESDPNGNGWVREYDAGSLILTEERGDVDAVTGAAGTILERTYHRYDELGRSYQEAMDIDLATDERTAVDPDDGANASRLMLYDAGSRVVEAVDAEGNATTTSYDAADRRIAITDALGNDVTMVYDDNSNLVSMSETDVPGPDATGGNETYVTTFLYDELNRMVEQHQRGLGGSSIDHLVGLAYDSRGNTRLVEDAEGNWDVHVYDDRDLRVVRERFDDDPTAGGAVLLIEQVFIYDRNDNLVEQVSFGQPGNPATAEVTSYAYDFHDRVVRIVNADSDDPIDGSNDGGDAIFDRVEIVYDEESLPVQRTDQRGVLLDQTFDPGRRLAGQQLNLPPSVPGVTRQEFSYDRLNRIVSASNDFAQVGRSYDSLSRLESETQSIRLDGSGFVNGWEQPVVVDCVHDRESNRIGTAVSTGPMPHFVTTRSYDALNRVRTVGADYFGQGNPTLATYIYQGPWRVQSVVLGNGAARTDTFDAKRRVAVRQWASGTSAPLVGAEYGYDDVDNARFERISHDNNLYDHFGYNDRYEVTAATYRSGNATPPGTPQSTYLYDAVHNRTSAEYGGPFSPVATTDDSYTSNPANEYDQIVRSATATNPGWDLAGNATSYPVLPETGFDPQPDVTANAAWDAFHGLFQIDTGATARQNYRYDPFQRRVAVLTGFSQNPERRFVYDGWSVVEERRFDPAATASNAPSTLDRIYVLGAGIDDPLLAAIDRDQDGQLGGSNSKNIRDIDADQEYYFLGNRLGSVMALLDADNGERVLEYYRYTVFGEPVVIPVLENFSGLEVTPGDLADNVALGTQRISEEFGNTLMFTGRRWDDQTGLYYHRNRYYEPRSGRFLSRDPLGSFDGPNAYAYVHNNAPSRIDPLGLAACTPIAGTGTAGAWALQGWERVGYVPGGSSGQGIADGLKAYWARTVTGVQHQCPACAPCCSKIITANREEVTTTSHRPSGGVHFVGLPAPWPPIATTLSGAIAEFAGSKIFGGVGGIVGDDARRARAFLGRAPRAGARATMLPSDPTCACGLSHLAAFGVLAGVLWGFRRRHRSNLNAPCR